MADHEPDPRIVATQVTAPAVSPMGMPIAPGAWVSLIELTRLHDGRAVAFSSPDATAFYLITAKTHRDAGERMRELAIASASQVRSGELMVETDAELLDAFGHLATAILLALAAVEALANATVDDLPDNATVSVERAGQPTNIAKAEMVRRLSLSEKLALVFPLATGRPSIKGTRAWEDFVALRRLRDSLVHLKERGYSNDPDVPSAFGQLFRGDGSRCIEQAVGVINAVRPEWLDRAMRVLR